MDMRKACYLGILAALALGAAFTSNAYADDDPGPHFVADVGGNGGLAWFFSWFFSTDDNPGPH
jgi:hypothetical protein